MHRSEPPRIEYRQQCELFSLNRATFYRVPGSESDGNLALMRRIDEQFLRTPFYGTRRMAVVLGASVGHSIASACSG